MSQDVDALLDEAQRLYAAGDAHGALACWARVLDVVPEHHVAVQYTAFVRGVLRIDDAGPATPATPTSTSQQQPSHQQPSHDQPQLPSTIATATADTTEQPSTPRPRAPSRTAVPTTNEQQPSSSSGAASSPLLAISWAAVVDEGDDAITVDAPRGASAATVQRGSTGLAGPVVEPLQGDPGPSPSTTAPEGRDDGSVVTSDAPASVVDAPASASSPASIAPAFEPATATVEPAATSAPKIEPTITTVEATSEPTSEPTIDASATTIEPTITTSEPTAATTATLEAPPASSTSPVVPAPEVAGPVEERVVRPSIRFDEPTPMAGFLRAASQPPTPAPVMPTSTGVPREVSEALFPAGRPEERVVRQSIRFDEPPPTEALPTKARKAPVAPAVAAPVPELQPPASVDGSVAASPWDDHVGPAAMVDLDATPSGAAVGPASAKPAMPLQAPPFDQARIETPPLQVTPTTLAGSVEDNDALMSVARELFELGDFSGSLERVEQVLRTEPQHEGARAYLQRNEATLTKMYESKIGDLSRAPRQLIRPDEMVWVTMHHRAGFVLSQVDGMLTFDDLIDVAGIKRFDAVRILADLVARRIIG